MRAGIVFRYIAATDQWVCSFVYSDGSVGRTDIGLSWWAKAPTRGDLIDMLDGLDWPGKAL